MEKIIYRNTLLIVFLFSGFFLFSQKKFDLNVKEAQLNIEGKSLTGYESAFDFERDYVRKGWWKYTRKFANPTDMRSHYVVTIPSSNTDGNVDLVIYGQASEEGTPVVFRIGIEDKKYKPQVEELLKEFKKDLYIQFYLKELELREEEAKEIADDYAEALLDSEKRDLLNKLNVKREEVEDLKQEMRKIQEQ